MRKCMSVLIGSWWFIRTTFRNSKFAESTDKLERVIGHDINTTNAKLFLLHDSQDHHWRCLYSRCFCPFGIRFSCLSHDLICGSDHVFLVKLRTFFFFILLLLRGLRLFISVRDYCFDGRVSGRRFFQDSAQITAHLVVVICLLAPTWNAILRFHFHVMVHDGLLKAHVVTNLMGCCRLTISNILPLF